MIYLNLFWTFFKIGLFTIGGGYAMIPLINAEVVSHGWLTEQNILDFIAISESTPGAFAVNIATFVGSKTAGFFGAVCTTLGVVMPSFLIILIIANFFKKLTEKPLVKDAFYGLRPAVVGLIGYAFISMLLKVIFSNVVLTDFSTYKNIDYWGVILFVILFALSKLKLTVKGKKRKMHPILLILISAGMGMLVYGVIV